MSLPDMTRRRMLAGLGIAGVTGLAGRTTLASNQFQEDEEQLEEFGAVRVGNLVPDLVEGPDGPAGDTSGQGPAGDTPGRGPPGDTPGRRGAHAPDSTALDVYVGKPPDMNPTIGQVHYSTFAPEPADAYLQVPAREYDVTVTQSGDLDPTLIETDLDVEAGVRYTALAVGRASPEDDEPEFQSLILEDAQSREEATAPEGAAEGRFVHASPNAGPVDIVANGMPILEDAEFGDASPYVEIPPGEYTAEVQSDGETVLSVTAAAVSETRLTVYVIGLAGVDDTPTDDGLFGLSTVATIDGLNPLPDNVLTR